MKKITLAFIHFLFQSFRIDGEIKRFAKRIHNEKILEIGSGDNSSKRYFSKDNEFTESDICPSHKNVLKLDITKMKFREKYDIIIAIHVLDDVFDYQTAIKNVYNALKKGGRIFFVVPAFYPLHDIPRDYFRFTEFSLKRIFDDFRKVKIKYIGLRRFPLYYIIEAEK